MERRGLRQGGNFMFVVDGRIKLPDRSNVLPGVSMKTVLELAEGTGVGVDEDDYCTGDIYPADEGMRQEMPWRLWERTPSIAISAMIGASATDPFRRERGRAGGASAPGRDRPRSPDVPT